MVDEGEEEDNFQQRDEADQDENDAYDEERDDHEQEQYSLGGVDQQQMNSMQSSSHQNEDMMTAD